MLKHTKMPTIIYIFTFISMINTSSGKLDSKKSTEQVSVSLDKREALCILMQHEIELMYTFGIIAF